MVHNFVEVGVDDMQGRVAHIRRNLVIRIFSRGNGEPIAVLAKCEGGDLLPRAATSIASQMLGDLFIALETVRSNKVLMSLMSCILQDK